MPELTQWVNLPKNDAFVEDDIKSTERLGKIKFKGKFKTNDLANFKIKLIAEGDKNVNYSIDEILRLNTYRNSPQALPAQLSDDSTEIIYDQEFDLPAAGGNKYKIEAKYKDKVVVSSSIVVAARKMFYEVISMPGVNAPNKATIESELDKVFNVSDINISCKEVGSRSDTISKIKTIESDADYQQVINELKSKLTSTDHNPYVIPITFVDYIASYKEIDIEQDIEIGLKQKLLSFIGRENIETTVKIKDKSGQNHYLYYNMVDEMDKDKLWLQTCEIIDTKGRVVGTISRDSILSQDLSEIKFKVSTELSNFLSSKKGTIKLKVRVLDSVSNGFAWKGCIVVALKRLLDINGNRTDKQLNDYFETIKHEFGHVFKQASTGDCDTATNPGPDIQEFITESSPDSHDNLYGQYHKDCGDQTNNYGHQGPHCKTGMTYTAATQSWKSNPGKNPCIMFGSSGLGTRSVFCDDCKKTLRKVDIR